mmetsp:Transcript_14606/g.47717  ORF Transcript_14606/g.47717 Transcript_14606/m.47717 type:complete len:284 (-) Transcript_14606:409-1260(-)|eukprot:scaffold10675_cov121-Isochrysis_galbana.AAC.5
MRAQELAGSRHVDEALGHLWVGQPHLAELGLGRRLCDVGHHLAHQVERRPKRRLRQSSHLVSGLRHAQTLLLIRPRHPSDRSLSLALGRGSGGRLRRGQRGRRRLGGHDEPGRHLVGLVLGQLLAELLPLQLKLAFFALARLHVPLALLLLLLAQGEHHLLAPLPPGALNLLLGLDVDARLARAGLGEGLLELGLLLGRRELRTSVTRRLGQPGVHLLPRLHLHLLRQRLVDVGVVHVLAQPVDGRLHSGVGRVDQRLVRAKLGEAHLQQLLHELLGHHRRAG